MKAEVYCLMVTGKDDRRIAYARLIGIPNFDEQTYPNKKMIIVNHGDKPVLNAPRDDVYELRVEKGDMTLGDLRNLSLDLVPLNALWICWDDDDTRERDYLSSMASALFEHRAIAVFAKNRLEINLANGYTFKSRFERGNTHILCMKLDRLRYLSKDTLEDVLLQDHITSFNKKYVAIENDPRAYVRIIHQNNTSPFAKDDRDSIVEYANQSNYSELEASDEEKAYAARVVRERYGFFLYRK